METVAVTTAQMWLAAGIAASLDLLLGAALWRALRPPWPRRLGPVLLAAGSVFFALLYGWAAWSFWDTCYGAVLPGWVRWAAPGYGALTGLLGWPFWWVARRVAPRRPIAPFLALGALQSVPGHLHGIYARGLLERCEPVLGISASSALVFGLFEFGFYWAVLLGISYRVTGRRSRG